MTDDTRTSDSREFIAHHIYLASIYFVIVGIVYLWAYWLSFDVNILDYLALTDVIKATAYPITFSLAFLVIINAISDKVTDALPELVIEPTPSSLYRARLIADLIKLAFLGVATVVLALDIPRKSEILAVLLSTFCYYQLGRTKLFSLEISNKRLRANVIFVMTSLPALAFVSGKIEARQVQEGNYYSYVSSEIDGFDSKNTTQTASRLRLLGAAGDFTFLYNPNNQATMMMKLGDDKPLVFKKNRKTESFSLPVMIRQLGSAN